MWIKIIQDITRSASFSQEDPKILKENDQQTYIQMEEKKLDFIGLWSRLKWNPHS